MFAALMLGLTMLTNVSYAQHTTAFQSLNSFVSTEIGFSSIEVNGYLPNVILGEISKEDWNDIRSKILQLSTDEMVKFRKLVFSDHYGLDIDFFYSSYTTNFEITIYVKPYDDTSKIKSAVKELSAYAVKLRKDLSLLNSEYIYGAFISFENIDVDAVEAMLKIDDDKDLLMKTLNKQACFIKSELDKNEKAETKIKDIALDDQLTEQLKIEKVIKILKKKDLYKGELKLFLSIDTDTLVTKLKDILNKSSNDCSETIEDNLPSIMEYRQLMMNFHDLVARLNGDNYNYVFLQMKEGSPESYYEGRTFSLHLNIEDLYYKKADLPIK